MKNFNKKMLRVSIIWGVVVFAVTVVGALLHMLDHLTLGLLTAICLISCFISNIRWFVLYDSKHKEQDVFGVGLKRRTLPHFEENEPEMNAIMFKCYMWLALTIFVRLFA